MPMPQLAKIHFYPACRLIPTEGYGKAEIGFLSGAKDMGLGILSSPSPDAISLQFGNPKWGANLPPQGRNWLWTMIESTKASKQWVDNINRYYERIIVPSPCQVDYFRESGVTLPIHYIPLGVDAFPIVYKEREISNPFTFLTYSYGDMRKGAELVVLAFLALYRGNMDYKLIIKARDNADVMWLQQVQSEQIEVIGGKLSEDALQALYQQAHCFVFPSRAEGFGLPPREAVLSGLPTITSRWLGLWDSEQWAFPLPVERMVQAQYMSVINNAPDGLWAEPNFDILRMHMAYIPQNYERAIAHTEKGACYLNTFFTWKESVKQFIELL